MSFLQQPGIGGEVIPHQDNTFLYTDPPSVVAFWVALEDATKENGCLWALPESHKGGTDLDLVLLFFLSSFCGLRGRHQREQLGFMKLKSTFFSASLYLAFNASLLIFSVFHAL
jgi:hypothetical protein